MRSKEPYVDKEKTHQWMKGSGLKAETEGFIVAAQDQALYTRSYQAKIILNGTNPLCRICRKYEETVDHIISGCPVLAPKEYMDRHDKIGQYIHWKLCQHYNFPCAEQWYNHHPEKVVQDKDITILWDFEIHTDRHIKANRPDITIKNHKDGTCLLIDMTVPSDRNTPVKEYDKLSKYKDLEIEIHKMWKMKTEVIPVVIGALIRLNKIWGEQVC